MNPKRIVLRAGHAGLTLIQLEALVAVYAYELVTERGSAPRTAIKRCLYGKRKHDHIEVVTYALQRKGLLSIRQSEPRRRVRLALSQTGRTFVEGLLAESSPGELLIETVVDTSPELITDPP